MPMLVHEYEADVMRTMNPCLTMEALLIEGLLGLNSEAGEAGDIFKKYKYQGHPFDKEHIAIELGDAAWYLVEAAHAIGYSLEEILQMNIEKRAKRYPNGFEAQRSLNRKAGDI